jgi:hypothetical protein
MAPLNLTAKEADTARNLQKHAPNPTARVHFPCHTGTSRPYRIPCPRATPGHPTSHSFLPPTNGSAERARQCPDLWRSSEHVGPDWFVSPRAWPNQAAAIVAPEIRPNYPYL